MGQEKDFEMERCEEEERKWNQVCQQSGFECNQCHSYPLNSEREVYFETGLCGACAHSVETLRES